MLLLSFQGKNNPKILHFTWGKLLITQFTKKQTHLCKMDGEGPLDDPHVPCRYQTDLHWDTFTLRCCYLTDAVLAFQLDIIY